MTLHGVLSPDTCACGNTCCFERGGGRRRGEGSVLQGLVTCSLSLALPLSRALALSLSLSLSLARSRSLSLALSLSLGVSRRAAVGRGTRTLRSKPQTPNLSHRRGEEARGSGSTRRGVVGRGACCARECHESLSLSLNIYIYIYTYIYVCVFCVCIYITCVPSC